MYLVAGLVHPTCGGSEDQMRAVLDEFETVEESMPLAWKTTLPSMRDIFDVAVDRPSENTDSLFEPPEPHDPDSTQYITYETEDIRGTVVDVHARWAPSGSPRSDGARSDSARSDGARDDCLPACRSVNIL